MEKTVVNVVRNAKGQFLMQVQVAPGAFLQALEQTFEEQRDSLPLAGDSKTLTRARAEETLGADFFYPAAAQKCCLQAIDEIVAEEGLAVAGYPEITHCDTDSEGLRFTAVCDPYPQVKLGEYKSLRPQLERPRVTDEELEQTLEDYALRAAREVPLDRPAGMGDWVRIDMIGTCDGKPFSGGSAEDYPLQLGSRLLIPGLEEGMAGMAAGDERNIPVTFPEDYTNELRGRDAVFHIKLRKVYEQERPQVDEAFARTYFETDLASLREDIRAHLLADKLEQYRLAREAAALEQAAANMTVALPESMVRKEVDALTGQLADRLARRGGTLEDYRRGLGIEEAQFWQEAEEAARLRLREGLLLRAVAQAEGFGPDRDFEARAVKTLAQRFETDEASVRKSLSQPLMQQELLRMRVLEVVLAPEEE